MLQDVDFVHDAEPSTQVQCQLLKNVTGIAEAVSKLCGTVLFREDELHDRCYIVLAGQVTLSAIDWFGSSRGESMSEGSTRVSSRASSKTSSRGSRCSSKTSSRACSPARGRDARTDVMDQVAKKLALAFDKERAGKPKCDGLETLDTNVVCLGAGRLFGDLALLQGTAQGFTATCTQDCQLLVIEKAEFQRVLKHDSQRLTGEKLDFLQKYLPGMSDLPSHKAEPLLHCFQKKSFAKGSLLPQGTTAKKSVCLVSKGSVFLSCNDVDVPIMSSDVRRLGSLFRGGVFGSLEERHVQPCTVYCTSSCELYVACGRKLEALTLSVRRSTQKYFARATEVCLDDRHRVSSGHAVRRPISNSNKSEFIDIAAQRILRHASVPLLKLSKQKTSNLQDPVSPCLGTLVRTSLGNSSLPVLPKLSPGEGRL